MSSILKTFLQAKEFKQAHACERVKFKSGARIMLEGEESLDVFYIEQGHVRINKRVVLHDGRQIQSGFCDLGPGETFGELNLFDGSPRSASVVACDDVELTRINRKILLDYLDSHPAEAYQLFKYWLQRLASNIRQSNDRSSHLFAWGLNQYGIDDNL
jgi:CRP/FNR family transcriptional regulator, cyclic AMP receptor protein